MPTLGSPKYALRITFQYDGTQIRKVSQQKVEKLSPPSHDVEGHQNQVGFWYELRDANNKVVYRRVIHNPLQVDTETPSATGGFARRPVQNPNATFQIVVPELDNASTLVLLASPHPPSSPVGSPAEEALRPPIARVGIGPAQEIARFNLKEGAQ
jgi:hypothetical protein